jgi:exodeoxyribonuclease VII large subunit
MDQKIYTVSALTRQVKEVLEMSFPRLWVEGEISNLKFHSSGHIYFTLKDENAQINCAMWRSRSIQLLFRPQDGMKILVEGEVQVYEKGGTYQLIIFQIQPAGVGALQLAFEELKQKLFAEGLFDEQNKKPLPAYPEKVGIVTSPTGAAIRDIVSVAARRFPGIQLILYPVRVQGEGAAAEIAEAIRAMNEHGNVDVLIVGRGGGSLEDLWAFNEEVVARAIFESEIPVVSAVGHEVDYSIADFVADQRAPTPSAAVEMVVKDRLELSGVVNYYQEKLGNSLKRMINEYLERISLYRNSYAFRKPQDFVFQKMQQIDDLQKLISISANHMIKIKEQDTQRLGKHLNALNPIAILNRGYSICYKGNQVVKDVKQVTVAEMVNVKLSRGEFLSRVESLENNFLGE